MGSYPALPSGNNPAAGLAAGFASSAASGNGLMSRLQAAAQQKAELQRQKDAAAATAKQQGFADQMEAVKAGGLRSDLTSSPYANTPATTPEGYAMPPEEDKGPFPNPKAQGAGQTVSTPGGIDYYIPTASEKEQSGLNSSNSFVPPKGSALEAQLQKEIGYQRGDRIPLAHVSALTGLHKALNEHEEFGEPKDVYDPEGNVVDTLRYGKNGGVMRANPTPSSGPSTPGARNGGAFDVNQQAGYRATRPAAEKPDVSQIIPGMAGPNGGPLIYDRTSQSMKEIPPVPGSKQTMTAAQTEADKDRDTARANRREDKADAAAQREQAREQADRDRAQKQIDIFNTREQEQHQLRQEYGKVLSQPNTNSKESNQLPVMVVDPKSGRETPMTEERRAYFQSQYDKATGMADTWHQQAVKLIQRHGGDTGQTPAATSAGTPQPTPAKSPAQPVAAPAASPGKGTAAPAAPAQAKTVGLAQVRAYAKAKGVTEAEAIKAAKAEGFSIAGQ